MSQSNSFNLNVKKSIKNSLYLSKIAVTLKCNQITGNYAKVGKASLNEIKPALQFTCRVWRCPHEVHVKVLQSIMDEIWSFLCMHTITTEFALDQLWTCPENAFHQFDLSETPVALMFIMVIENGKKMKSSIKAIIIPSLKGAIYIISEKRPSVSSGMARLWQFIIGLHDFHIRKYTHTPPQHTLSGNSNAARNM